MSGFRGFRRNYFFDRQRISNRVTRRKQNALKRGGAMVMTIARRSIKRPRRLMLSEMTPHQQKKYTRTRDSHGRFLTGPQAQVRARPFVSAAPGKPPFSHTRFLPRFILFGWDGTAEQIVVGPMQTKTGTAHLLEHGGTAHLQGYKRRLWRMRFRGNPFMQPALEKAAPKLPALFQNLLD